MEALLPCACGARPAGEPDSYEFGLVRIDLVREKVWRQLEILSMLPLEYKLPRHFVQHRRVTVSRHQLPDEVWDYDAKSTARTVDVHVSRHPLSRDLDVIDVA
jgi:two-component system phosphate regulon response regulator PhoB